jgi:hypothetical protein
VSDIFVDPADGRSGFVIVADVTHQLAREIRNGSEDTSRNNLALNLGKPNFHLVEPAGVGWGVEAFFGSGLVNGEVNDLLDRITAPPGEGGNSRGVLFGEGDLHTGVRLWQRHVNLFK